MQITNIHNAKTNFSKYLKIVSAGEEVIICSADKPIAKLIPYTKSTEERRSGVFKGKITIEKDFDMLPEDFMKFFS